MPGSSKEFLDVQATTQCGFTLKRLLDMIRAYRQFSSTSFVVKENNYTTKTINAFIVYNLDNWSKIPLKIFTLKYYLFGTTRIIKNHD